MFRLVLLLSVLLCGVAFADPPEGWPVAINCTRNFVKISTPSYSVVEPFTLWWSDDAAAYQGYYSFCTVESDGVGGFYLVTDLGDEVVLSDLPFAGWPLANNDVVVVQSLDYGVGTMVGPTVYMFACGFAAGIPVVCLLWILWCLIRVFRMAVQGVSF